jgi:hypothetical protein
MFNKGEGGFLDCDLYPFCANLSDGKLLAVANPNAKQLLGTDVRELKDVTGKVYGKEMFAAAEKPEGTITEVSYMFAVSERLRLPLYSVDECRFRQRRFASLVAPNSTAAARGGG